MGKVVKFTGEMTRDIPDSAKTLWDISQEEAKDNIAGFIIPDEEKKYKEEIEFLTGFNTQMIRKIIEHYAENGFDVHDPHFLHDLSVACTAINSITFTHVGMSHDFYPIFEMMKEVSGFDFETYSSTIEEDERTTKVVIDEDDDEE